MITLREISNYLPYETLFSIKYYDSNEITIPSKLNIDRLFRYYLDKSVEKFWLYLRPLSDLTKEIEINGEKFVPIIELLKIHEKSWYLEHINTRYSEILYEKTGWYYRAWFTYHAPKDISIHSGFIHNEQYWKIQKLFEWHFDIFGLIERGDAIICHIS